MTRFCMIISFFLLATQSFAKEGWLIATESEQLNLDEAIVLDVVKPSGKADWPEKLSLTVSHQDANEQQISEIIELFVTTEKSSTRCRYTGQVRSKFNGDILAKLTHHASNRLLMTARYTQLQLDEANNQADMSQPLKMTKKIEVASETIVIPSPKEERTISVNEPLYFIVGSNNKRDFDARFQISFKYRPFDPDASVAAIIPYASNLYLAYTQTSIWDLGSESSPFEDTTYRPSIYYDWDESGKGYNPNSWKFGLEHESNGRDGEESRSLNVAFVQPIWKLDYSGGKTFTFMPKIYHYLEKADNSDLHHYRGYVDWIAKYGRDDAAILTAMYRQGTDGYAQGQLDLSYPISDKIFGRTGTFLHFQLLSGYGETLIDYNKDSDTQLRIGLTLAR